MSLTVVPIRDGPSLNDVVAQVRAFADRIEAGEYGEVDAVFAVMPRAGDYPTVFGWGDINGTNDPVIQLELAKFWLLTNLVKRV
jgi:hypothetical protein